jgi:hypothetical protein
MIIEKQMNVVEPRRDISSIPKGWNDYRKTNECGRTPKGYFFNPEGME